MDIKKNNIAALDLNTNKNKIYDDNKELTDIEPIDWDDM